jgi:hypothetical protein
MVQKISGFAARNNFAEIGKLPKIVNPAVSGREFRIQFEAASNNNAKRTT